MVEKNEATQVSKRTVGPLIISGSHGSNPKVLVVYKLKKINRTVYLVLFSEKVVEAKFNFDYPPMYFDAASGLSYAQTYLGEDSRQGQLWRKGYINRDGIYMIVVAPVKSTW